MWVRTTCRIAIRWCTEGRAFETADVKHTLTYGIEEREVFRLRCRGCRCAGGRCDHRYTSARCLLSDIGVGRSNLAQARTRCRCRTVQEPVRPIQKCGEDALYLRRLNILRT